MAKRKSKGTTLVFHGKYAEAVLEALAGRPQRTPRKLTSYERAVTGIDERARDRLIAGLKKSQ